MFGQLLEVEIIKKSELHSFDILASMSRGDIWDGFGEECEQRERLRLYEEGCKPYTEGLSCKHKNLKAAPAGHFCVWQSDNQHR